MKKRQPIKIGIIGCGAIGSGIAQYAVKHLKHVAVVVALYDHHEERPTVLAKQLGLKRVTATSLQQVVNNADIIVEAINSDDVLHVVKQVVVAGKDILVMSVGKLLAQPNIFKIAARHNAHIYLPSGAIAGIDAIKAASLVGIKKLTLTTRKPIKGFKNNKYLEQKKIDLSKVKNEKIIFAGSVSEAVKAFPRNINVAATLALAANATKILKVNIVASAKVKRNTHCIEAQGDFGKITTITENVISPTNPKTSYLAVLSGMKTLDQYVNQTHFGT